MNDPADQPIDLRRAVEALRRSRWLIFAIVATVTGVVAIVSLTSAKRYTATATLAYEARVSPEGADPDAIDRLLGVSERLVTASGVLDAAGERAPGGAAAVRAAELDARVDPASNLLELKATTGSAASSAGVANAVAETFLAQRAAAERTRAAEARRQLTAELNRLRGAGSPAGEADAIRDQLSNLALSEVTAGSDLRLAEPAVAPESPSAPKPLRATLLALLVSLFVAVLAALARDRLRPRVGDPQELGAATGLPLLAVLPDESLRHARRGAALERFESLPGLSRLRYSNDVGGAVHQALVREAEAALPAAVLQALPPERQRAALVLGTGRDVGADHVAAVVARSLALQGHPTALVRADHFSGKARQQADGLAASWAAYAFTGEQAWPELLGRYPYEDLERVFDDLDPERFQYLIGEGPPMGGALEARLLARHAQAAIVVGRRDRTTVTEAAGVRRLLDAVGLPGLGVVMTGAPADAALLSPDGFDASTPPPRLRRLGETGAAAPLPERRARGASRGAGSAGSTPPNR